MIKKLTNKKTKAAVFIQRMYRRYKQRKTQLGALKKKNELRKLMEE